VSNSGGDLDNSTGIQGGTDGTPIGNDGDALNSKGIAREYTGYSPNKFSTPGPLSEVSMDASDQTMVRGQTLTDEGSFRDDFTGSALTTALTGTLSFTNGSDAITGTGTALSTEVPFDVYIKKTADADTNYVQVSFVQDDENLTVYSPYAGTTAASTAVISNWKPNLVGGGSLSVGTSNLTLTTGNGTNRSASVFRSADYLPYNLSARFSISQRATGQASQFGFLDDEATTSKQALFYFDGALNTTLKCRSSSSSAASDLQETTVVLPSGNTSTLHTYRIDVTLTQVTFTIDNVVVAIHQDHIPGPYDSLGVSLSIANTTPNPGSGSLVCDWVFLSNQNQLEVTNGFNEPFLVKAYPAAATYSAAATAVTPAATATDLFTITGSATKSVRIFRVRIDGTQTTTGTVNILLVKRSTANSGGTSSTLSSIPHDASSSAATAVVRSYTANPTLGTAVGTIRSDKVLVPAVTALGDELSYVFGESVGTQPIVLRGTGEVLAINLNATTVTGGSFNASVEWVEES
jgi:hypothetical protein